MIHIKPLNLRCLVYGVLAALLAAACSRDESCTGAGCRLTFSADTLRFDTVFTTIGSATRRLMVYNPGRSTVHADVALAGGRRSMFRLNIDGRAAEHAEGVEIAAGDSLYVFVEVTVDPLESDMPVVVSDSVLFRTAAGSQCVRLEAYGQDVFILRHATIGSEAWTGAKPYLIYGQLTVDTLQTLHIAAGVRIYLHQGAGICVRGSMTVAGEADHPVVFAGDRLEKMYRHIPGQWGSIRFGTTSRNNVLRHAIIRNGTNGLIFENPGGGTTPALALDAVTVMNMTQSGLVVVASDVEAVNTLVGNCGAYSVGLLGGGTARLIHCTIAGNYSPYISRKDLPALTVSQTYTDGGGEAVAGTLASNVFVGNSIVHGYMSDELAIDLLTACQFSHCLLRTTMDVAAAGFTAVTVNADPLFMEPSTGNFRPDETSPARDAGDASLDAAIPEDLNGNSRVEGSAPDLGACEWTADEDTDDSFVSL